MISGYATHPVAKPCPSAEAYKTEPIPSGVLKPDVQVKGWFLNSADSLPFQSCKLTHRFGSPPEPAASRNVVSRLSDGTVVQRSRTPGWLPACHLSGHEAFRPHLKLIVKQIAL